jgi:hypothetical protein
VNACTTDDHRNSSHECAWQRPRTAAHGGEARRKRLGFARPPPTARPVLQIEKQKPCVARPGWLLGSMDRKAGVWVV